MLKKKYIFGGRTYWFDVVNRLEEHSIGEVFAQNLDILLYGGWRRIWGGTGLFDFVFVRGLSLLLLWLVKTWRFGGWLYLLEFVLRFILRGGFLILSCCWRRLFFFLSFSRCRRRLFYCFCCLLSLERRRVLLFINFVESWVFRIDFNFFSLFLGRRLNIK